MQEVYSKKELWGHVNERIDHWLQERQELIIDLCALSSAYEYKIASPHSQLWLKKFCQILIDYISAGHFDIYYELMREAEEFNDGSETLGKALLPHLNESTDQSLAFNDTYADTKITQSLMTQLLEDLSSLGEAMATRFDYEDQLINAMHNAHADRL